MVQWTGMGTVLLPVEYRSFIKKGPVLERHNSVPIPGVCSDLIRRTFFDHEKCKVLTSEPSVTPKYSLEVSQRLPRGT